MRRRCARCTRRAACCVHASISFIASKRGEAIHVVRARNGLSVCTCVACVFVCVCVDLSGFPIAVCGLHRAARPQGAHGISRDGVFWWHDALALAKPSRGQPTGPRGERARRHGRPRAESALRRAPPRANESLHAVFRTLFHIPSHATPEGYETAMAWPHASIRLCVHGHRVSHPRRPSNALCEIPSRSLFDSPSDPRAEALEVPPVSEAEQRQRQPPTPPRRDECARLPRPSRVSKDPHGWESRAEKSGAPSLCLGGNAPLMK